jgi:CheY-like chemotaxis protein
MFHCTRYDPALGRFIGIMSSALSRVLQRRFETLKVLVVDDDHYMRKVVRAMLLAIGIKNIHEASDGISGLEAVRELQPDLVIVDWEMPMIDGAQFVRMVRSPADFPLPDVPIIILSGHADRWRVVEAARLGAHEYLLKPVSTKALHDRIISVLGYPRPTVQLEGYYGPAPRRLVVLEGEDEESKPPGSRLMI